MVVSVLYIIVTFWLAAYSLHSLYLLWIYHRVKGKRTEPVFDGELPLVTIQLPVYNELTTIERLVKETAAIDYPGGRLQIQILDDSTDETTSVISNLLPSLRQEGVNIEHIHRADRAGFKASALANALNSATGEYIAIFDADFIPPRDFIYKCLPWFNDPTVGCVQGRWGHLNRDYSMLTRLQAMAIDAHFMVEQTARSRSGLLMNFNGSGGMWRKACIEDAGGWQAGTLTEDFDLSYRAQMKGWRLEYLPDLVIPGELPVQMAAFKQQQARWARGSLQTARKLLVPLLRSPLPIKLKITGTLHLTHYLVHPLILLTLMLSIIMRIQDAAIFQWAPLFMLSAIVPPLLYLTSPAPEAPSWLRRLKLIPLLLLLSIGISVNNTKAALLGLFVTNEGVFVRTPKFAVHHSEQRWEQSRYAIGNDPIGFWEFFFMLFAFTGLIVAWILGDYLFAPWLFLYSSGYGLIVFISVMQSIRRKTMSPM